MRLLSSQKSLQGSATLTATRVFGTLALLNALRFPIMDLGGFDVCGKELNEEV